MLAAWRRLVRFGFHLLYNQLAWTYDAVAWVVSGGEWSSWRRTALQCITVPRGAVVLEVGFGTGSLHVELALRGWKSIGVDRSRAMGRIARRRAARSGVQSCLLTASAMAVPLGTGAVDALVCTFPSDYIVDAAALAELHRVLKPGAEIAVVVHGVLMRGVWRRFTDVLFQATGQGSITGSYVPSPEPLEMRYLRLTSAFLAAGLDVHAVPMITPRGYAVVLKGQSVPH
ncbi:MAG: methyltransferase domain-containing protein [Chloroflexi bacterium]|nr:methyltransferase domain-containing protein [Chloroflexota bacterium]